jgi:hypothetical protein
MTLPGTPSTAFTFFNHDVRMPSVAEMLGRFITTFPNGTLTFDPHAILGIEPHDHETSICRKNQPCWVRAEILYFDEDHDIFEPSRWFVAEDANVLVARLQNVIARAQEKGALP